MEINYITLTYVLTAPLIAVRGGAKMFFLTLLLNTQGVIVF